MAIQVPADADRTTSREIALRGGAARVGIVSAALLIPIFWHKRIEAGDLGSHLYNAWLVQLIRQGKAPGLYVARQWNNVLFDSMLSGFGSLFGLHAAERIAVSLAVLVFFWGSFALIAAATRRAPWSLAPLLAVFAYGWTFEMGFMNYYISLGLCFWVLAAFWRGGAALRILALALVPLIWLAHPLGVLCLAGVGAYALAARAVPSRYHGYLLLAAGIALYGVRVFLASHYRVSYDDFARYLFYNGADQLVTYSVRTYLFYVAFVVFCVFVLGEDSGYGQWRAPDFWRFRAIPMQLYVVVAAASMLLPTAIELPRYGEPISYLTPRLSSVAAILVCWMLAATKPRKWHAQGYAILALIFFASLYYDTGRLSTMEANVERAVAALPPGHRVLEDIDANTGIRVATEHVVDRACIGHCISYTNYEPGTGQFRVRARPGNSFVDAGEVGDPDPNGDRTEELVKAIDPPVYFLSQCKPPGIEICIRQLTPQEVNDVVEGNFDQ